MAEAASDKDKPPVQAEKEKGLASTVTPTSSIPSTPSKPSSRPTSKPSSPNLSGTPNFGSPQPDIDEWGLPIRRKVRVYEVNYDTSDEEDDQFEDAQEETVPNKKGPDWEYREPKRGFVGQKKKRIEAMVRKASRSEAPVLVEGPRRVSRASVGIGEREGGGDGDGERIDEEDEQVVKEEVDQVKNDDDKETEKIPAEATETIDGMNEASPTETKEPKIEDKELNTKPEDTSIETKDTAQEQQSKHKHTDSQASIARSHAASVSSTTAPHAVSEWSHQQLAPTVEVETETKEEDWQTMPAFAPFKIFNDDGKLIADEEGSDDDQKVDYNQLGGAGKGYTRVQMDEDAQSATSMDDNTAYLFKETTSNLLDEDEEGRDMVDQMQATKEIMTEGQRIAYVGLARLAMLEMIKELDKFERTRGARKVIDMAKEAMTMWSQKIMVRLYAHMEIESAEQVMIEQLSEHGVQPDDLTPILMQNARIKNPLKEEEASKSQLSITTSADRRASSDTKISAVSTDEKVLSPLSPSPSPSFAPEQSSEQDLVPQVQDASEFAKATNLDIDIRWTILCDLFLILIADGVYDSRSRKFLEVVGNYLKVSWLDISRFEKRITDAIEMQEAANKENWNEDEHMEERRKQNKNKRLVMMGLATVGGGLVIGLSAGLLAPLIGAGLAAGFTTFGVAGTGSFLAGAGGAAIITTTGVVTGSNIGFKASKRRTGAVQTFEYRPLHNNKRVNLIVTIAGWLAGKVDDVRLPFSTVDPMMGDIYSLYWEPDMLRSMGDTINILATEALTQALQQVLGSTILVALMAAIQLPIVLTKLAYLIDNPWTVSLARADLAGLILADSLIDRNLGSRPITLVGFSLGSRVIYACLRELAKKGQFGIIQNVYMFGSPIVFKKDEYLKIRSIVSGRFVNGYATNDWILGYLFRATSGGVMRVAGLAPVEMDHIENYNVTEFVPGHMSYRTAMPRLLREVGWEVESDEFTEIEDPDPDNHEKRQRELINEIEEARKQIEQKQTKSRFGWFRKKNAPEKKEWEMYDEKTREGIDDSEVLETKASGVLFDIEALRAEVAELAAQGVVVKELPGSTLPPMKIDLKADNGVFTPERSSSAPPNKSIFATPPHSAKTAPDTSSASPTKSNLGSPSIIATGAAAALGLGAGLALERTSTAPDLGSPSSTAEGDVFPRPSLMSSKTAPLPPINLEHNAWADEFEDDFGQEKEMKMTFE